MEKHKKNTQWETSITHIEPNKILLRGYPIDELMGELTFAETVYLAWKGELPSEAEGKLLNAILVSSVDHGTTPPSCLAARNAASTGAPVNACIASGILAINRFHGGAIENSMKAITKVRSSVISGKSPDEAADETVAEYKKSGLRIAGFGHRFHTNDPRTKKIFALAKDAGFDGGYLEAALALERALERSSGRKLPLNVDGAIGAVLLELGIEAEFANVFFILSRVVGLAAHAVEEKKTQKPMRRIRQEDAIYTGPKERTLSHRRNKQ